MSKLTWAGAVLVSTLLTCTLFSGLSLAQNPDYTLAFPSGVGGASGSELTVTCLLNCASATGAVQGWSMGICHDALELTVLDAVSGATTLTVNGGVEAAFVSFALVVDLQPTPNSAGVNHAAVITFAGMDTLAPGDGYELLDITYQLIGSDGFTALNYCGNVTDPMVMPAALVITVGGGSNLPTTEVGLVEIGAVVPPRLSAPTALTVGSATPTVANITLESFEHEVSGFAFGLSHDPAVISLTDVQAGAALAGADFFVADTTPSNGDGLIVAAVLSFAAPIETLSVGLHQIVDVTYEAAAGATMGQNSALTFTGDLQPEPGSPATGLVVGVEDTGLVPTTEDGDVTVTGIVISGGFIRGDVNQDGATDISDPTFLLNFLFASGPTPACMGSADINDDSGVDVSDPTYLLNTLFASGPVLPAPTGSCDDDPTPDALTCDDFSC